MKACLINPKTGVMISDSVFPPLGLWYASAALRAEGWEVTVADMAFDDAIPDDADVYGITGTSPQAERIERLVPLIWTINPQARIVVGGPHATLAPDEVLGYGCDAVLRGEAEEEIDYLFRDTEWRDIAAAERIEALDDLPFPDRRQAWRYRYSIDGLPATMMMTSRGCPHRCAFCSKPLGNRVYMRSVENIMMEAREIKTAGFGAIMFVDDTLGLDRERLGRLCGELGSESLVWRCLMRGDQVTPEIARAMRDGGCVEVGIGIESGSERILKNIQKGETIEQIREAIGTLRTAGIRVKGFFIVGLPGEDWGSLRETEEFLLQTRLDDVDFTILSLYPGSPIYEHPADYDVQWTNSVPTYYKADPQKYDCMVRTRALSGGQLLAAREHFEHSFKRWR